MFTIEWFFCPDEITPNSGLTGPNNTIYICTYIYQYLTDIFNLILEKKFKHKIHLNFIYDANIFVLRYPSSKQWIIPRLSFLLVQCNPDIRELSGPEKKYFISGGFSYNWVWSILYTLTQALIWDQRKSLLYPSYTVYLKSHWAWNIN